MAREAARAKAPKENANPNRGVIRVAHSHARTIRENGMVTRQERLAEFMSSGEPPAEICEILCEDHNGRYMPPFLGRFAHGHWRNSDTGKRVEVQAVGWRSQRRALGK